jgi:TatA/E family protein of Tat protein translocase
MFNIGPPEILLILLIALVVVGPAKLPELGRSIGKGLREFRKVQDEVRDSINFNLDIEPDTPAPKPRGPRNVEADRAAEVAEGADASSAPDPAAGPDTAQAEDAVTVTAEDADTEQTVDTDRAPVDTDTVSVDTAPAEDPATPAPTEDPATPVPPATGAPSTNGSTPPPAEE